MCKCVKNYKNIQKNNVTHTTLHLTNTVYFDITTSCEISFLRTEIPKK